MQPLQPILKKSEKRVWVRKGFGWEKESETEWESEWEKGDLSEKRARKGWFEWEKGERKSLRIKEWEKGDLNEKRVRERVRIKEWERIWIEMPSFSLPSDLFSATVSHVRPETLQGSHTHSLSLSVPFSLGCNYVDSTPTFPLRP